MNHDENVRTFQGRSQILIHRVNGEQSWQDAFDARRVVRDHPHEWSLRPFSAAEQKEALKHMPATDRRLLVPSEGPSPYSP